MSVLLLPLNNMNNDHSEYKHTKNFDINNIKIANIIYKGWILTCKLK